MRWQQGEEEPSASSGEDSAAKSGGEAGESDHTVAFKENDTVNEHDVPQSIPVNMNSNTFAGPSGHENDSEEDADAEEEAEDEMKLNDGESEVDDKGDDKKPTVLKSYGSISKRCEYS